MTSGAVGRKRHFVKHLILAAFSQISHLDKMTFEQNDVFVRPPEAINQTKRYLSCILQFEFVKHHFPPSILTFKYHLKFMERFNSKLFEKYTNLKKRKFSSIEESNQKRISDVLQYQSAMELLIGDLKNENDKLRAEILSTEERYHECQKLLLEGDHKTKILSNEVGALKELLQKNDNADRSLQNSACKNPAIRLEDSDECLLEMKSSDTLPGKNAVLSEKNTAFTLREDYNQNQLIPDCCKKRNADSEVGIGKSYSSCAFHILVELLVGMNFVVDCQTERPSFSVIHQMSGYNFTLSWVGDRDGEEGKMAYQVSSLGTIESIALDWMKEDIVFSTAMCPVFFDRLSRVVGNK